MSGLKSWSLKVKGPPSSVFEFNSLKSPAMSKTLRGASSRSES